MHSTLKNVGIKVALLVLISFNYANSQSISYTITDTDPSQFRSLNIRPYFSFNIPQTQLDIGLPINLNIDGQYWFPKLLDVRSGISLGTFIGFTGGATYHLSDKVKIKNNKFVVSSSTRGRTTTTRYFKAPASSKVIFGPCADFALGKLGTAGFFTEVDLGLNWQTFTRAYANLQDGSYIRSGKNGWIDLKAQAVIRSVNWDSSVLNQAPYRLLGVGGQLNLSGSAKPWKGITVYGCIAMGAVKMIGVIQSGITKESTVQPILNFGFGACINLL